MVVRLKDAIIESIEDTETKRLKQLNISCKSEGASLSLELPIVLSDTLSEKESIDIIIDTKLLKKGEDARLYADGTVFKITDNDDFEVVGTFGGLRLVVKLTKPTSAQRKTFESGKFYFLIE